MCKVIIGKQTRHLLDLIRVKKLLFHFILLKSYSRWKIDQFDGDRLLYASFWRATYVFSTLYNASASNWVRVVKGKGQNPMESTV